ncbi:TraB/GumN family protein [Lichenifustis flavocetrariae]|uniref:TraB/GumN family protein n=1 Tax=Lichenifustis flavocetrariae TaxID=2949735 RepID=A0AA41YUL9_9HYPH|nr:TraB/GumN family protein [Lichenifustis flavocetrariae]MCW6508871.1 TraB/GumN family protein [Lichenifustis flavocetrariae]
MRRDQEGPSSVMKVIHIRAPRDRRHLRSTLASLALALCCCAGLTSSTRAACHGHDVLRAIMERNPDAYAEIATAAQAMPFNTGTLFRVSRDGISPSFLFGTLHVADPRLASLPAQAKEGLDASKAVVLETLDLDGRSLVGGGPDGTGLSTALTATPQEKSKHLLGGVDFARLKALTALRGLPETVVETAKPSALALMLDLPTCAVHKAGDPPFVDEQVLGRAKAKGLKTIGLESALEQFTVADGLSPETQATLLKAVLTQSREAQNIIESSILLYQQGRTGLLLAWTSALDPFPGKAAAAIPLAFVDRTIRVRNLRMRDRLLPILSKGGAFIAVGALHLPGQDGLAALCERAGYRVERLL